MDDLMKVALEIVKAQASVRPMTPEEMADMIDALVSKLSTATVVPAPAEAVGPAIDPKNSVREKSVICLECGKSFKVLTKRHLATHGLTPEEYKAKYGLKKGTALVAKSLARDRRKTMQDMKLWERRGPIEKKQGPRVESKFPAREEAEE